MEIQIQQPPTGIPDPWSDYVPIISNGRDHHIYLTDNITEPCEYNKLCSILTSAYAGDKIYFYINNGGGYVDSAFMIIDAIKQSKATVISKLSGTVASSATLIALHSDDIVVADYTHWLSHNYSGGTHGKGHEMKAHMDFMNEQLNISFREIHKGFLTDVEMQEVIDGRDMWLSATEVRKRWKDKGKQPKGD